MESHRRLGVGMDHSMTYLIEYKKGAASAKTLLSLTSQNENRNFGKDVILRQKMRQEQVSVFFRRISAIMLDYQDIILFGPTKIKREFLNTLKKDIQFYNTKIDIETTESLSEKEMHVFVKQYFTNLDDNKNKRIVPN